MKCDSYLDKESSDYSEEKLSEISKDKKAASPLEY